MDIACNNVYACRVVKINDMEVDYLSSLEVDNEQITKVTLKGVDPECYNKLDGLVKVNIVVKCEEEYLTIVDCQMINRHYKMGPNVKEKTYNLEYISSLLLIDYLWDAS